MSEIKKLREEIIELQKEIAQLRVEIKMFMSSQTLIYPYQTDIRRTDSYDVPLTTGG